MRVPADGIVRPAMTVRECAELHLLVDGLLQADELAHVFVGSRQEQLTRARRSLHGALRGAGYVQDDAGWHVMPQRGARRG